MERPAPVAVAPLALGPPPKPARRWRRRMLDAAVVTGTLAALPLTNYTADQARTTRVEDRGDTLALVEQVADADDPYELSRVVRQGPAGEVAAAGVARVRPASSPAEAVTAAEEAEPSSPTPIATFEDVEIVVPSMETAVVGFHESASPGSVTLASAAPLEEEHNVKETPVVDDPVEHQVAPVVELPTRNRASEASSAVDIAIPEGEQVLAPVSGRVTAVSPYFLYGQHPDVRVEIEPEGRPDLRVVVIHVSDVEVQPGDRLIAGETAFAGTATQFPFESQIDRFAAAETGAPHPHVHVEMTRVG